MKQPVDLDRYIADLKKRQQQLFIHYDEIGSDLHEISNQLQMAEEVRAQIQRHFRLFLHIEVGVDEQLRAKFAHLTIKEMLTRIAFEAGGILDLAQARRILVRAGVFKDERNAATSMAPILSRHEETFKRVGRGVYLLLVRPQSDLSVEVYPSVSNPVSMLPGPKYEHTQPSCQPGIHPTLSDIFQE